MNKNRYNIHISGYKGSILMLLFVCSYLFACKPIDVYEKNTTMANQAWKSSVVATGSFDIQDTTANYKLYMVLRHTDAYPYENMWVNIGLQAPNDSMHFVRYNLSLVNGSMGWEGTGMNDIWEVRKLLQTGASQFKKAGIWNFSISHLMRNDPLPAVLSAGLRVEKQ